jgi:hypothetical protein
LPFSYPSPFWRAPRPSSFPDQIAPEGATGTAARQVVTAKTRMVAAAKPDRRASRARYPARRRQRGRCAGRRPDRARPGRAAILRHRRRAFALWYDAGTGEITTYDARETAPAAAGPELFLDDNGEPLAFFDAVLGGRSVGVPGIPRLMEELHARHGRLDWADLFAPAIELAEEGFAVSPRLACFWRKRPAASTARTRPAPISSTRPARRFPKATFSPTPPMPTRCARWPGAARTPSIPGRSPRRSWPP